MVVLLISSQGVAHDQSPGAQPAVVKAKLSAVAPDLAEIIPLASKLSGRLAVLKKKVEGVLDISALESKYVKIEDNLKDPVSQLQRLKDSKDYRFKKLVALRETIGQENDLFEKIDEPLNKAIRQLGIWRSEWLAEKKRWNGLQSSLREDGM